MSAKRAAVAVVVVAAAAVVTLLWLGAPEDQEDDAPEPAYARPALFAPSSFLNRRLARDAPLDTASGPLMDAFRTQIRREQDEGTGPWIQTDHSSTPIYRVPRRQPLVPVALRTGPWGRELAAELARGVPIPPGARPAAGSDGHLTVHQPATDTLWELWRARRGAGGWEARWGGVLRGVSRSPGHYAGSRHNWGSTASSISVVGGVMTLAELRRGRIDHALALNVPDARAGTFSWPAQRSDGTGGLATLPEGARLRLDPALDVESLRLTRLGRIMARAAQRYGIVVRDRTHKATAFFGEDPTRTGRDPYRGGDGYFSGTPADALAGFPWQHLQLLRMTLCTRGPCAGGPEAQ
ncbi:MAG TPA: hypothetical protein VEX39_18185 [Thermoleophilaceae bacterium]|nr:hypothetical protein [Thermoleophilaceae bacterium]